jgi:hypothetical protein
MIKEDVKCVSVQFFSPSRHISLPPLQLCYTTAASRRRIKFLIGEDGLLSTSNYKVHLNNMPNVISSPKENTTLLHYKDQSVNSVWEIVALHSKNHMKPL